MASPDQAFSEPERATLLREILLSALPSTNSRSQLLATVVRDLQIQPSWDDIRLPQGRTVGQCKSVFQDIMSSVSGPLRPPLQTDIRPQQPGRPPMLAPQPEYPFGAQRAIQPKPPHYQHFASESPQSPYSPTSTEMMGRKRGRPNREESERRQRARDEAAARGEKDPFPSRSRKKQRHDPAAATPSIAPAHRATLYTQPPPTTLAPLGMSTASSAMSLSGSQTLTTTSESFSQLQAPSLPPLHASAPRPSPGATISRHQFEPPSPERRGGYSRLPRPPSPGRPSLTRHMSGSYQPDTGGYRSPHSTQPPPLPPIPPQSLPPPQSSTASALHTPEQRPEQRSDTNGNQPRPRTSSSSADAMEP